MLVLAGLSPRLTPSSLCRHFVIDSPCDWSLNSSVCQRRKNILPLKVIKSDRGSLQGGRKWPWEVSNTLSLMWRGFLPVCLPVCTSTTCFDSCRCCLIGPLKNKKEPRKGEEKKSEMVEWRWSLSFFLYSLIMVVSGILSLTNHYEHLLKAGMLQSSYCKNSCSWKHTVCQEGTHTCKHFKNRILFKIWSLLNPRLSFQVNSYQPSIV